MVGGGEAGRPVVRAQGWMFLQQADAVIQQPAPPKGRPGS